MYIFFACLQFPLTVLIGHTLITTIYPFFPSYGSAKLHCVPNSLKKTTFSLHFRRKNPYFTCTHKVKQNQIKLKFTFPPMLNGLVFAVVEIILYGIWPWLSRVAVASPSLFIWFTRNGKYHREKFKFTNFISGFCCSKWISLEREGLWKPLNRRECSIWR